MQYTIIETFLVLSAAYIAGAIVGFFFRTLVAQIFPKKKSDLKQPSAAAMAAGAGVAAAATALATEKEHPTSTEGSQISENADSSVQAVALAPVEEVSENKVEDEAKPSAEETIVDGAVANATTTEEIISEQTTVHKTVTVDDTVSTETFSEQPSADTAEPVVSEPIFTSEPVTTEPVTTEPTTSEPVVTEESIISDTIPTEIVQSNVTEDVQDTDIIQADLADNVLEHEGHQANDFMPEHVENDIDTPVQSNEDVQSVAEEPVLQNAVFHEPVEANTQNLDIVEETVQGPEVSQDDDQIEAYEETVQAEFQEEPVESAAQEDNNYEPVHAVLSENAEEKTIVQDNEPPISGPAIDGVDTQSHDDNTLSTEEVAALAATAGAASLLSTSNKGRVIDRIHEKPEALESLTEAEKAVLSKARPARSEDTVVSRGQKYDDLKRIKGIGILLENKLNNLGIHSYQQIADLNEEDVHSINETLGAQNRIQQENWIEQAKILSDGKETAFSKIFDKEQSE